MDWEKLGEIPALGVDLFFVLSGFLITGVLLRAKGKPRYFFNFYARRILRIAPLYFVLLIFMFSIQQYNWRGFSFEGRQLRFWVFATYIQNLYYYMPGGLGPMTIAITWSLAIEEQFYTVWPLLVRRLTVRSLTFIAGMLIVIAPLARAILPHYGYDAYINPLCRIDAMAMGALVTFLLFKKSPSPQQILTYATRLAGFAVLLGVVTYLAGFSHILAKSVAALLFTALLLFALAWVPLINALSLSPLRLTGKISYCLYIVHPTVGAFIYNMHPGPALEARILRTVLTVVSSYVVAMLSWHFFERPILSLKRYFESSRVQAHIDKHELV